MSCSANHLSAPQRVARAAGSFQSTECQHPPRWRDVLMGRVPSTSRPRLAIIAILAIGYGPFLAFVAFWPSPIDKPVAGLLNRVIVELHERGIPAFVDYDFIEFTANIALFIPVGFLFGLLLRLRGWPVALIFGPILSAVIEAAQRLLLDERYATVSDVLANSIGASLGVVGAVIVRYIVQARDVRVIARHEARSGRA